MIVTREVPAEKITKGKVITVQDPDHPAKTRAHRVVRRSADGTIVTKGDANRQADSSSVKDADVIGLGVIRVPYVGRPAYWMVERNLRRSRGDATAPRLVRGLGVPWSGEAAGQD